MKIILQARSEKIYSLVENCARGHITFAECCTAIEEMGFKTTSVYEMVRLAEEEIKENEQRVSNGRTCITSVL